MTRYDVILQHCTYTMTHYDVILQHCIYNNDSL